MAPSHAVLIDAARAALKHASEGAPASDGPRVLARGDSAPAIALLVTRARPGGDVVLPLREGRSFVGRGVAGKAPYVGMTEPAIVEQAQWFIWAGPGRASVVDAASTNLSVLCPADAEWPPPDEAAGLARWARVPGAVELPHLNTLLPKDGGRAEIDAAMERRATPLREGDALRSAYATFVFAWV
jgi:hypothetical protein